MAETDFMPIYPDAAAYRPAYNSRQFGAGFRAPGFVGSATSSAQPQTAPTQGAQTSADATAALRGLYPARADENGMGIGERSGGISAGQQPTREADSLVDLGVSIAKGLSMMSGPFGLASGLHGASQRDNRQGYSAKDLFGDGLVGRALAAAFGSAPTQGAGATAGVEGFDPSTGMAPGERALDIDRSVTSEPLAPPAGAGEVSTFGGGQFDPTTGMAAGERDLNVDRSVTSESIGTSGGGYQGGSQGDPTGGQGPEHLRNGGPVGRPGSKPVPRPIVAHTGEFVQRPEAVNKYGPSAMSAINALKADPAGIKKATKSPPSNGKMMRKDGSARDALAGLKAKR